MIRRMMLIAAAAAMLMISWLAPIAAQNAEGSNSAEIVPQTQVEETQPADTQAEEPQEEVRLSMRTGSDYVSELRLGTYLRSASGSQTWVRQYDARTFNPLGIELFDTFGYKDTLQYWFDTRDLILGNEELALRTITSNTLGFEFFTESLTHRLSRESAVDPWTFVQLSSLRAANPAIPQLVFGRDWDSFVDLSPTGDFRIDRRATGLNTHVNLGGSQRARLVAGWWQQHEGGSRQLLFRAPSQWSLPGQTIPRGVRGGVALPISRTTNIVSLGTDVSLGSASVLNYRLLLSTFDDDASSPLSSQAPLNTLTRIKTNTTSHVVKGRSEITDRLTFTGVYTNKTRENNSGDIPTVPPGAFVDSGQPISRSVKIRATNAALVFRATDALTVTGRFRELDYDNRVPPVFATSDPTAPENQRLSRNTKSFELEGAYTGIPRAFLRLGYERRDTTRDTNPIHGQHEEFEHPFTGDETDWNIVRLKGRWYPTMRLNLSAGFENWSADQAGYQGLPNERTKVDVNGTYMLRDDLAVYGTFNWWDESNDQIRVASVPTAPPATPGYQEERISAAGQGFNNTTSTISFGAWYALSPRLSFDANYAHFAVDSEALWVLGTDPRFLPHLLPDSVPYKGRSDQWSIGSTYVLAPRWRVRSSFLMSNSFAAAYVDPTIFLGLGPAWTPFDGHFRQWMVGFSHDLGKRDRLDVDFTQSSWNDQVDETQDGRFGLWRFAWSRAF